MKTKSLLAAFTGSWLCLASLSHAADITATGSGNWSSTVPDAPWPGGVVPGPTDDVDVEAPFSITVDSTATIQFIYGSGTVTMAPGATLNVVGDPAGSQATYQLAVLDASAPDNTIIYSGNPFWAKHQDYYHLVFSNSVATNQLDFYNGTVNSQDPAAAMTIAGNMTLIGKIKVQQGDDFTIGGNLFLGTNSTWDCSSYHLTVVSNTMMNGLLLDLDGALGSNYFGGDLTVSSSAIGWNVSDVTHWAIGGSLTNNGTIVGKGYGGINFNGSGSIAGTKTLKLPTMTVNGTYRVATSITIVTNTPTLNGTLIFDLANTNQIVLLTNAGTALYYSGNLSVINSGPAPTAGATYKLFNAPSYGGAFASTSLPPLAGGLTWTDDLLNTGSISVSGAVGAPVLTITRNGAALTLSWNSGAFPGYSIQVQTNNALGTNWSPTGSGTVSPYLTTVGPANIAVFYRLVKP